MFRAIIQIMRPHQYIKNFFVFAGFLFAHQWHLDVMLNVLFIFTAFCCVSSSIYILNDITDIDSDRQHPIKSNRPLPSGKLSISTALIVLLLLLLLAIFFSGMVSIHALFFVLFYFTLNIFYSLILKKIVILDVVTISIGFMCRILAGTYGLGIDPSQWLLLCGFMITLFLGFSKRFSEVKSLNNNNIKLENVRSVLKEYSISLLERFMAICATCTIMCYGLYTMSPETIKTHKTDLLIFSVPIVMYGILRYLLLVYTYNKGNDTSKDIITDKHLYITIIIWLLYIIGIFI